MSQQPLQSDGVQNGVSTTRAEGTVEDNFTAMRHAAMSMFKQRTKDLTMVSSMTAETQEVEKLNTRLQCTINQLHEQKAVLEAQIETEERRVKEREQQLREVHAMLAQMKEDQGVFSGVQRSSEKVAVTLSHFVTQYTAKGGDFARLMERSQERAQGWGSSEWRAAANDLRRRQAILGDHVKQIERDLAVPKGFGDVLLEWSRGVWKQQQECASLLRVCEQVLHNDVGSAVHKLLPPSVQRITAQGTDAELLQGAQLRADACMEELNALVEVGISMEKESENVGLCFSVVPSKRVDSIRAQWVAHHEALVCLRKVTTAAEGLSKMLEKELAAVDILSVRVAFLTEQISDDEKSLQEECDAVQNEIRVQDGILPSWNKAIQIAMLHKQHELACQATIDVGEREVMQLEVDLVAKMTVMEARWMALHTHASQLQHTLRLEEQHAMERQQGLQSARDEQKENVERLAGLRGDCAAIEGKLRRECEEAIRGHFSDAADFSQVAVDDAVHDIAVQGVLEQFLQFGDAQETGVEGDALSILLSQTGLEAGLLSRVAHCMSALLQETDRLLDDHKRWKQAADDELSLLAA